MGFGVPVFPLQGAARVMDLHCLLPLFIHLGESRTLLQVSVFIFCSRFSAHLVKLPTYRASHRWDCHHQQHPDW